MVLAMMAGRISACPRLARYLWLANDLQSLGSPGLQRIRERRQADRKKTPPIVAIPFSKAPSVKLSTGISPRSRFTRRGAATPRNRTQHSRAERVSSSSLASEPCLEAWFERARHALAPHRPKTCEADLASRPLSCAAFEAERIPLSRMTMMSEMRSSHLPALLPMGNKPAGSAFVRSNPYS